MALSMTERRFGRVLLEVAEQRGHRLAAQAVLRAAQVAREDRVAGVAGVLGDVGLGALDERADHAEAAVVGRVTGGHRLQLAAVEQVH
jgi:hypothetical protein